MTQKEQNAGNPSCPRCKCDMGKHSYTRQQKLYMCPECEWKIPHDKITREPIKIELEIEIGGDD